MLKFLGRAATRPVHQDPQHEPRTLTRIVEIPVDLCDGRLSVKKILEDIWCSFLWIFSFLNYPAPDCRSPKASGSTSLASN